MITRKQFKKDFPKQLRDARIKCGYTQTDLGLRINTAPSWISHFETGGRLPDGYRLAMLIYTLGNFLEKP